MNVSRAPMARWIAGDEVKTANGGPPMSSADIYAPYYAAPFPPVAPSQQPPTGYYQTSSFLSRGTVLHKGFYDLLAMIPTPASASRFWTSLAPDPIAGPRYEDQRTKAALVNHASKPAIKGVEPARVPVANAQAPIRKGRRITKDMVSSPTGFIHLVHASDAEQAEAILRRWGPDGMGKLGDPKWAVPIKNIVKGKVQARAINEVVSAMTPEIAITNSAGIPQLRVMNGMSTPTASIVTPTTITATLSNVTTKTAKPPTSPLAIDGLPPNIGNIKGSSHAQLNTYLEHDVESTPTSQSKDLPAIPPQPITPSLTTLEKAVAARIYFEGIYFAILRQPPSREQRRLALEKELASMRISEEAKQEIRDRWITNESDYLRDRRAKVDPSAFVKLKTIGHGAFGVVSLVKEKKTGKLFAMKQLRKTDMLRKGQEGHVRAERDVLKNAALVVSPSNAQWIVKLFYSFQDTDHLYLILEYMSGGDLLNLLIERDIFEEGFARFYIAEMILAVEQCHKQGFIHRDIKPDNFLFAPDGHIKLSDFGLATDLHWAHDTSYYEQQRRDLLKKHGIDLADGADTRKNKHMDRKTVQEIMGPEEGGLFTWRDKNRKKLAYSVCGTNSYMSPEVIRGQGYSFSCDWWSLGVIMFECLYGYPPFVSNSRHVTRQKILNWRQSLKFPTKPKVSFDAVSLMQQLLCEPEDRLGSEATASVSRPNSLLVHQRRSIYIALQNNGGVDGAEYIKAHSWFRGVDWANIHRYPAPFKPDLSDPEDTRHFDPDIPAEPLAPANGAPPDATRDPLLKDQRFGAQILDVRKALAFAGFTHKSPRAISYVRADQAVKFPHNHVGRNDGGSTIRQQSIRSRALSL